MLGKLYHALAVISIAVVLAGGALFGLLYGTGRLTPERVKTIARVLRGELDEVEQAEVAAAGNQPSEGGEQGPRSASAEEIRQQRRDSQLRRALGERAYRDLISQRELLDQVLQHLITKQERFQEERATAKAALERRLGAALDDGFEKERQYVASIAPKQAKEHLVLKWKKHPADAVHLLNALPLSKGKRILEQLKTPEEIQIMHELLERLSKEKVDPLEPRSGKTAGN
ncbi:MAG: hypothetical protein ACE5I3_00540 [Phycisphaerae bacterium]